jgi:cellulase/cellobiase CelA1
MMLDPRARRLTERFLEQWLHLGRLVKVPKVMQVYPALTFDVRHEMVGETERRVHHLLVAGASLSELLQAKHTWLTDALASYYGIPTADAPSSEPDEAGYRRVELPGDTYGGLLTQGALSTLHAGPDASSPVKRGVFVRERLLCQPIPPPPPGIDVTPPAPDPAASTREQYEQHSADPVCKGCHERIDGVGFALEHFDGAGVWRPSDGEHPIDATGALVAMPGSSTVGTFDGANELAAVLSQSTEVDRCYVKTWLTHATGLVDAPPVQCGVAALQTQNGGTTPLTAPLTHLAASDHLRLRVAGPDEAAAPLGPQEPNLDAYHALPEAPYPPLPGEGAPGSGDAVLSLTTVSQWATGYCADGVVSNQSDQEVQWKVSAKVDGEIVNIWNAVQSKQGNLTTFTGVSWNSTVAPGGTQSFGFCANL